MPKRDKWMRQYDDAKEAEILGRADAVLGKMKPTARERVARSIVESALSALLVGGFVTALFFITGQFDAECVSDASLPDAGGLTWGTGASLAWDTVDIDTLTIPATSIPMGWYLWQDADGVPHARDAQGVEYALVPIAGGGGGSWGATTLEIENER